MFSNNSVWVAGFENPSPEFMVLDLAAYPVTVGVHFPRHVLFALGQREGNLRVLAARLHRARLEILDDLHESIIDIDKV